MRGAAGTHTHTMYSGEGGGEKGASLVRETPTATTPLHAGPAPAALRPEPPAPGTRPGMETGLLTQGEPQGWETSRVCCSNGLGFFPSQKERGSASEKRCFPRSMAPEPGRAGPGRAVPGERRHACAHKHHPALRKHGNQAHTEQKNSPHLFSGRNHGNKFFSKGFHCAFNSSLLEAKF